MDSFWTTILDQFGRGREWFFIFAAHLENIVAQEYPGLHYCLFVPFYLYLICLRLLLIVFNVMKEVISLSHLWNRRDYYISETSNKPKCLMRGWEDINKLNTMKMKISYLLLKLSSIGIDAVILTLMSAVWRLHCPQPTTPGMGTHSYLTSESHQTTANLTICSHHQLHEN